jgi:hypothetical protein
MQKDEVRKTLDKIKEEMAGGDYSIGEKGFWAIVNQVKRDPVLVEEFADQIGMIDAEAFRRWARLVVPLKLGHLMELVASLISFAILWYGVGSTGTLQGTALVTGAFALITTLHPFAHYVVGRLLGIRFLFYFPDGPALVEPTLKTDYATYLRATPLRRAAMHAAGPVISTLVFILTFILAYELQAPEWSLWVLAGFLVLNTPFELVPPVLVKLGIKKFSKSDSFRAYREWKLHRSLR